jgi:hypothetical protein
MSKFETVVQTKIYERLVNTPSYSLLLNFVLPSYFDQPDAVAVAANGMLNIPVYDDVPQGNAGDAAQFPYVTIGEDIHTDMSTDTELLNLVSITIHVWSRFSGRSEVKRIQGYIYDLLNRAEITDPDYKFVSITHVNSQSNLESDGETRHGVQTFNLIIEEL